MSNVLGDLLRELRTRAFPDLKMKEVAIMLGTTQSYLSKVETGYVKGLDDKLLDAMEDRYRINLFFIRVINLMRGGFTPDFHDRIINQGSWKSMFIPTDFFEEDYDPYFLESAEIKLINTTNRLTECDIEHLNYDGRELIVSLSGLHAQILKRKAAARDDLMRCVTMGIDRGTISILLPSKATKWLNLNYACIDNLLFIDRLTCRLDAGHSRDYFINKMFPIIKRTCPEPSIQKLLLNRSYRRVIEDEEIEELIDLKRTPSREDQQGEAAAPEEPS